MTALKVARNIARSTGLVPPANLVGNNNQDALRLLQAINDAGKYLAHKTWNCLQVQATISSSLTTTYAVPSDFRSLVPLTMWHTTDRQRTSGPQSPVKWQEDQYSYVSISLFERVRLEYRSGSQVFVFQSALTTAETLSYYYYSNGWVNSGSRAASVSADSDTFYIPEHAIETEAKWRFLKSIGQPFAVELEEAKEVFEVAMADDGGLQALYLGGTRDFKPGAVTPETGVGL